jgi:hypothetical protein
MSKASIKPQPITKTSPGEIEMPTLKLTKMPEREIRYDCDLRYIGPATPERRTDAEPTNTGVSDSVLLTDLGIEKHPEDTVTSRLDTERNAAGLERYESIVGATPDQWMGFASRQAREHEERLRAEEWQRRYDAARAYLKSTIRACELDYKHRKYPWES